MEKNYIIKYTVPLFGFRIFIWILAFIILCISIYSGIFPAIIFAIFFTVYSLIQKGVRINFENNTYYKYSSVLGIAKNSQTNQLPYISYILVKDTAFVARNRQNQITTSNESYEVALVGENRFKLVLLYSYDKEIVSDLVLDLQANHGYPIRDMTHEKFITEDDSFSDVY